MQSNSIDAKLLNELWQNKTPFVSWKNPFETSHLLVNPNVEKWDFSLSDGFVISTFLGHKGNNAYLVTKQENEAHENWIEPETPEETPKSNFIYTCNEALKEIESGQLEKVVISRVKRLEIRENLFPGDFFKNLCDAYSNTFISIVSLPQIGTWICASPEQLMKVINRKLEISSLAGTKLFNDSNEFGIKELTEQKIVTDFIFENVVKNNLQSIKIDGPNIIRAGNLNHLKSTISGELIPEKVIDLLKDLHPTPAVAGSPLTNALDFIKNKEKHNRGVYAGFLGTISSAGDTNLFVHLRSLRWIKSTAYLYVGCGITAGSIVEDEWEETENKSKTLSDYLVS